MAKVVSMTKLHQKLRDVVKEVLATGEPIVVMRHRAKLIRLVPVRRGRKIKK